MKSDPNKDASIHLAWVMWFLPRTVWQISSGILLLDLFGMLLGLGSEEFLYC